MDMTIMTHQIYMEINQKRMELQKHMEHKKYMEHQKYTEQQHQK